MTYTSCMCLGYMFMIDRYTSEDPNRMPTIEFMNWQIAHVSASAVMHRSSQNDQHYRFNFGSNIRRVLLPVLFKVNAIRRERASAEQVSVQRKLQRPAPCVKRCRERNSYPGRPAKFSYHRYIRSNQTPNIRCNIDK